MKILSLLIFFLFLCGLKVSAQTAEKIVGDKIKQLNVIGIDTVLMYQYKCSGCIFISDPKLACQTTDFLYLIWKDKKHNYIQLLDTCYEHAPLIDEMGGVQELFREHLAELIKEELKRPLFKINIDGKDTVSTVITSHDSVYIYTINLTGTPYRKVLSESYLNTNAYDDSANINYAYNQHTYLKQLHELVWGRIARLNERLAKIKK